MTLGPILVVDDDPDILTILKDNLELDGFRVHTTTTGKKAMEAVENLALDLVILDLSLPDVDGLQVCRRIRDKSDVPIIILTARDRVPDKVLGLETGADDYLVKPFEYLELAARIKACLRRRGTYSGISSDLDFGTIRIDPPTRTVFKDGEKAGLTNREFDLLLLLARNAGRVLSRLDIRRQLWERGELSSDTRAIDVHVQHLRHKLEANPCEPQFIVTVPGVGYIFQVPDK
ncbi:MAG: response regulator transcription factor [Thermodesulfobacteriota bacterium]